jgi:hypothetical protein
MADDSVSNSEILEALSELSKQVRSLEKSLSEISTFTCMGTTCMGTACNATACNATTCKAKTGQATGPLDGFFP